jgi:enolase
MFIKKVVPSLIKNSRGKKTIQISLQTYDGKFNASSPSGKSKGAHEVVAYNKLGIEKSLSLMKGLGKYLEHKNFMIKKIDDLKKLHYVVRRFEVHYGKLGGNVICALEAVFLKAAARANKKEVWQFIHDDVSKGKKIKMPMPVGNCIGGGLHSKKVGGKRPDFQEFLLIPKEKTFSRAVTHNLRAQEYARRLVKSKKRNDEGAILNGLANEEALEILRKVADKYKLRIGLDIASSSFYNKGYYDYENKSLRRDKVDQTDYVEKLIKKFKIFYVEDPMDEEDFSGFKSILNSASKNRHKSLIVGDDLTVTNEKRVLRAIKAGSINAMIIKPNQIGSIVEVKKVVEICKKHKIITIFSHRSGETMDDILADYCVGFGGDFIKCGIYGRERLIKLRRIIEIEKQF